MKEALPLVRHRRHQRRNARTSNAALGPLAKLDAHRIVFVNGHYRAELSKHDAAPAADVRPLSQALKGLNDGIATRMLKPAGPDNESVVALNSALATDGAVISIAGVSSPSRS